MIVCTFLCAGILALAPAGADAAKPDEPKRAAAEQADAVKTDESPEVEADELTESEEEIIERVNEEREKRGLAPLLIDLQLMKRAREHCQWMASRRRMVHSGDSGGENIAYGQKSPQGVMQAWMNSWGHRGNILNKGYGRIGVAVYRAPNGRLYWCQQFHRGQPVEPVEIEEGKDEADSSGE